jgi:glycosyltransferase involved in cell wall biosynthesis
VSLRPPKTLGARAGNSAGPESRLRIAYVVHTFHVGGLERCVARLVNRLDRSRFQATIVCLHRNGRAAEWIDRDDVPLIEIHKRNGNDPLAVGRLARVLKELRADVVHSHNWGTLVETALARRWARVPVHVHAERGTLLGNVDGRGLRTRVRGACARWAMNRADCVITVAESVERRLIDRCGRLRVPVRRIPNGVDAPAVADPEAERAALRRSLGVAPGAIVLGSVGRLVPVKDFGTAIDAVAQLEARETDWQSGLRSGDVHLVLVGDGPERGALEALAERRHVADRVHLVGQTSEVGKWLAAMDVYLNVSLSEGMSQSLLEAMAMGLPTVVTDVGDNAALVSGPAACGLVVPSGEAAVVAEAIARLLAGPNRRAELGENARARHAARYGVDAMIRTYEDLYWRSVESIRGPLPSTSCCTGSCSSSRKETTP